VSAVLILASLLKSCAPQPRFAAPNPVFDLELRHVSGPRSVDDLKRYGLVTLIGFHGLTGLVWLLARLASGAPGSRANVLTCEFLALATLALTLSADLYTVAATVSRVRHLLDSGRWDLLRLTALPGDHIVAAEYAIAQMRVWRVMIAETLFRLTGLVFLALLNPNTALMLVIALPVSLFLMVLVAAYLIEAKMRIQAVAALSMALGMRIHQPTFALLAALGMVLLLRLAQLVALGSLYMASQVARAPASVFCILPIACLSVVSLFYFAYRALERQSLRQAYRFATQADE
jgi:hypothetical protein